MGGVGREPGGVSGPDARADRRAGLLHIQRIASASGEVSGVSAAERREERGRADQGQTRDGVRGPEGKRLGPLAVTRAGAVMNALDHLVMLGCRVL